MNNQDFIRQDRPFILQLNGTAVVGAFHGHLSGVRTKLNLGATVSLFGSRPTSPLHMFGTRLSASGRLVGTCSDSISRRKYVRPRSHLPSTKLCPHPDSFLQRGQHEERQQICPHPDSFHDMSVVGLIFADSSASRCTHIRTHLRQPPPTMSTSGLIFQKHDESLGKFMPTSGLIDPIRR